MSSAVRCLLSLPSISLRTAGRLAAEILLPSESVNEYTSCNGWLRIKAHISGNYFRRGCGPLSGLLAFAACSPLLFNHRQLFNRLPPIVGRDHLHSGIKYSYLYQKNVLEHSVNRQRRMHISQKLTIACLVRRLKNRNAISDTQLSIKSLMIGFKIWVGAIITVFSQTSHSQNYQKNVIAIIVEWGWIIWEKKNKVER